MFPYICNSIGTNYIEVYRSSGYNIGNYKIRILPAYWNTQEKLQWNKYFEPNPDVINSYLLETNGTEYLSQIENQNDIDYFRFEALAGSTSTISLLQEQGVNVSFILYFYSNNLLEQVSNSESSNLDYDCLFTGTYIIKVYRSSGYNIGSYKIKINGPIVPVELSSFTATIINKEVILNWRTETETNNYGFEIERKNLEWEKIGFVHGSGTSNVPKKYSFSDKTILKPGLYLYRLKQIDKDGTFEYSSSVEVLFNLQKKYNLSQNYPNPFNPSTTIRFSLAFL